MNADFNVGFIHPQSRGEQLFNLGSLREFRGDRGAKEIELAIQAFSDSLRGLEAASNKIGMLVTMLERNEAIAEFDSALTKRLAELNVNALPRVSRDTTQVATLTDVLTVMRSEFSMLREMTERTIAETEKLRPQIQRGSFVATVLEVSTDFNQAKISLGFGRGTVEQFVSTACHATILAVEDTWPRGFEFLQGAVKQ